VTVKPDHRRDQRPQKREEKKGWKSPEQKRERRRKRGTRRRRKREQQKDAMDTMATNTGERREFRAPWETDQEEWQVRIREEVTRMMMPFMMEKEEIGMARILEMERKKLEAEMNEKLKVIREKEKEKEKEKERERKETRKEKRKRNEKEKGKKTGQTAKRQTRSRIGGEEEELDTEIEIDGGGLEEEEAETLREEESEDDKEESSEEEIREIKRRRDTIRLPKIIGDVVKEEEIRQFVEKVHEKIAAKESIKKIRAEMASTLVRVSYSLYSTRVKKETKPNTKEGLERILQAMEEGITKDRGVIGRKKKILQVGQKEDKPIQIWGARLEQQLSDCKEAGIHTLIETFVEGLRDEEIKKEMRGKAAARKDLMMEKIMELAERQ